MAAGMAGGAIVADMLPVWVVRAHQITFLYIPIAGTNHRRGERIYVQDHCVHHKNTEKSPRLLGTCTSTNLFAKELCALDQHGHGIQQRRYRIVTSADAHGWLYGHCCAWC
eukprot:5507510-Pyramimonas_sp.AAC.1